MEEITLKVNGMHCEGCENRIKKVISGISGIKEVNADYKTGIVTIKSEDVINTDEVKEKIEDLGFEVN